MDMSHMTFLPKYSIFLNENRIEIEIGSDGGMAKKSYY